MIIIIIICVTGGLLRLQRRDALAAPRPDAPLIYFTFLFITIGSSIGRRLYFLLADVLYCYDWKQYMTLLSLSTFV